MRILVSGGGSAGHISPALATIEALKSLDKSIDFLYIGQRNSMEAKIVTSSGLTFTSISAGKLRRYHQDRLRTLLDVKSLVLNVRDSFRLLVGVAQSIKILRSFKPDMIFLKGGFVCLPVGIAAHMLHMPFVIHESDLTPGLTNRVLAKWAEKIAVGFPADKYRSLPKDRLVYTGSPIRQEILRAHRLEGLSALKLSDQLPVVLVTGGSQGSRAINEATLAALPELTNRFQVVHLAGEKEIEFVRFQLKRLHLTHHERYHPYSFLMGEMSSALAAADVVVSRGGANAIAELAVLGKPTILIPNQDMAGHQVLNAQTVARAGAVRLLPEGRLSGQTLVTEIVYVLDSEEAQAQLTAAFKQFAVTDGAQRLAALIMDQARLHQSPNDTEDEDLTSA